MTVPGTFSLPDWLTPANGTQTQLQTDGTFKYIYDGEGNITRKTTIATGAVVEYTWGVMEGKL